MVLNRWAQRNRYKINLKSDVDSYIDACYDVLKTRYFDAFCKSNEDAYLTLGISSSTFYRNIRKAIRLYAAELWCVVIPDLILREQCAPPLPVT